MVAKYLEEIFCLGCEVSLPEADLIFLIALLKESSLTISGWVSLFQLRYLVASVIFSKDLYSAPENPSTCFLASSHVR